MQFSKNYSKLRLWGLTSLYIITNIIIKSIIMIRPKSKTKRKNFIEVQMMHNCPKLSQFRKL